MVNAKCGKKVFWLLLASALALFSIVCIVFSIINGEDSSKGKWLILTLGILLLFSSALTLRNRIKEINTENGSPN